MQPLDRLRRLTLLYLDFLRVFVFIGNQRNYLFWPMQLLLTSILRYLKSPMFKDRMVKLDMISRYKKLANQERYKGQQRKRDLYNSEYALQQRELQTSISGTASTSRIIGRSFTNSFGHSAYGIGDRLKAKLLGLDNNDYILLGDTSTNSWLIENYWTKYFSYVSLDEWIVDCLEVNSPHLFEDIEYLTVDGNMLGSEVGAGLIELKWQEKFPHKSLLALSQEDQEYGYSKLKDLGLPKVEWFVTFHFRRREYELDRNVQAKSYLSAIEFALSEGANVFVIGEDVGVADYINHPRFLDLTAPRIRDSRLNLFLLAECRFMVGSSSGPIDVPPLFGKGVLWTNCSNLVMNRLHKDSIVIPRIRMRNTPPSFEDFLIDIGQGLYENDSLPSNVVGVKMIQNTDEEILGGLKEMFSRDLSLDPAGQELEVLDAIKSRSGVISNRISLSFLSNNFAGK